MHYKLTVAAGETTEVRLRFCRVRGPERVAAAAASPVVAPAIPRADLQQGFVATLARRQTEADDFYTALAPKEITLEEVRTLRQAAAGMLWVETVFPLRRRTVVGG